MSRAGYTCARQRGNIRAVKIFYSWQSDTPRDIGRSFVREALDSAVERLDIAEAERPGIDQDTAGVLRSPIIAETIFRKIKDTRVVVADVTLTGQAPNGKRLINSNVALEVGYAIAVHDDEVLVKVMNTHYGPPEDLPFDLAHRRCPVRYDLEPGAGADRREKVLRGLAGELGTILGEYIAASRPPPEPFSPTNWTFSPACYWKPAESLVRAGIDGTKAFSYKGRQPLIYLHIWPSEKIPPLTIEVLDDYNKSVIEPLCGTLSGWSHERNRFGEIAYGTEEDNFTLGSTTQVFKTGEIWGVNHRRLRERSHMPGKYLPVSSFEQSLAQSLSYYITAGVNHFGYGCDIGLRLGLVNVAGYRLVRNDGTVTREIFEDFEVAVTVDGGAEDSIAGALATMLTAVYEAAGETRP